MREMGERGRRAWVASAQTRRKPCATLGGEPRAGERAAQTPGPGSPVRVQGGWRPMTLGMGGPRAEQGGGPRAARACVPGRRERCGRKWPLPGVVRRQSQQALLTALVCGVSGRCAGPSRTWLLPSATWGPGAVGPGEAEPGPGVQAPGGGCHRHWDQVFCLWERAEQQVDSRGWTGHRGTQVTEGGKTEF